MRSIPGILVALASLGAAAQINLFGGDSRSTGVFTGAGTTPPGLSCAPSGAYTRCSGFLASAVDGTMLDVTVTLPAGAAPHPLVAYLHGYGGSKSSTSGYDDLLAARGYAVLRHSARGFGDSWGQVNLADVDVEVADLRSLIGQVADDARLGVNPDAVAVAGASYGGGQSWLAAVQPTFPSPGGKQVRIRTVVPIAAWSDLLAALRPNGDAFNSFQPPGFFKLSFLQALFLGGIRRSPSRPYPNYPDYLFAWDGYALATEPNLPSPIRSSMEAGLAGYRSIFWQRQFWNAVVANAGTANQLPVFLVQGFTDDLFPVPEALRMMQALRAVDPRYPIAAYFGDVGHPRAANKAAEVDYALNLLFAWLDFYLQGKGAAPAGVYAAITRPGPGFDPADVIQVANWDALATGTARADFGGPQIITFDPANASGLFVDPVVFAGCAAFGAGTALAAPPCAPLPDVVPGDVAVYTVSAADLAASAGRAPGSFLVAGQPTLRISLTTAAPREQLDARVYAVTSSGRQLITRGTLTLDSGSLLAPIGDAEVELRTYGNLGQVGAADSVQVELTNVDSPYLTPSRVPSVTTLHDLALSVPVR